MHWRDQHKQLTAELIEEATDPIEAAFALGRGVTEEDIEAAISEGTRITDKRGYFLVSPEADARLVMRRGDASGEVSHVVMLQRDADKDWYISRFSLTRDCGDPALKHQYHSGALRTDYPEMTLALGGGTVYLVLPETQTHYLPGDWPWRVHHHDTGYLTAEPLVGEFHPKKPSRYVSRVWPDPSLDLGDTAIVTPLCVTRPGTYHPILRTQKVSA